MKSAREALSTWVFSNHDVVRHASRYVLPAGTVQQEWLLTDDLDPLPMWSRGCGAPAR